MHSDRPHKAARLVRILLGHLDAHGSFLRTEDLGPSVQFKEINASSCFQQRSWPDDAVLVAQQTRKDAACMLDLP